MARLTKFVTPIVKTLSREMARQRTSLIRLTQAINIVGNNLIFLVIVAYFLAPLTWVFVSAFRDNPSITVQFTNFTLGNFPELFKVETARWIRNSLFIGGMVTLMTIVTAFLAAYPFARFEFRGKVIVLFTLVMSMTIPLSAVMLPTFSLARSLGLSNTLIGVALVIAARQMPMALWVLKEFIATIPVELEEAARVDGAGRIDTLLRIVLPLTAPGLAVIGMMAFVAGWGDFTVSLILLNSDKLFPISMGIYKASLDATSWGYVTVDYGIMTAISLMYLIPPAIAFLFTQRYMVKGMVIGAVKG